MLTVEIVEVQVPPRKGELYTVRMRYCDLCWKLAAVLNRQAPTSILSCYGAERQPISKRNTNWASSLS